MEMAKLLSPHFQFNQTNLKKIASLTSFSQFIFSSMAFQKFITHLLTVIP